METWAGFDAFWMRLPMMVELLQYAPHHVIWGMALGPMSTHSVFQHVVLFSLINEALQEHNNIEYVI